MNPSLRQEEASRDVFDIIEDIDLELNAANLLAGYEYSYRGMKFLVMFFFLFLFLLN